MPIEPLYEGNGVVLLTAEDFRALGARMPRAGRPLRITRFEIDAEVTSYILNRVGRVSQKDILSEVRREFGPERAPSSSALSRFVGRCKLRLNEKTADI